MKHASPPQWLLETIVTFEELLLAVKKANPAIDEGGAGASSSSSSPLPALSPDGLFVL